MTVVEAFAPAKVNLALHVTGRRDDGYHLLDSLVMFADVGDRITVERATGTKLTITGPMSDGVPATEDNLVLRAARLMGIDAKIHLEKVLPHAAGLGGGSSDAAATLRALAGLTGKPIPDDVVGLGADVPVCLGNLAARMRGIGEDVQTLHDMPALHAVLVNPNIPLSTAQVFAALQEAENPGLPDDLPSGRDASALIDWLRGQRNDLQAPAIASEPRIAQVLDAIDVTSGCRLARMTGSGATCFGLYLDADNAGSAAGRLAETYPSWWVRKVTLNNPPDLL